VTSGGTKPDEAGLGAVGAAGSVFGLSDCDLDSLSNPARIRHLGQIPPGAFAGNSAPHWGHVWVSIIIGLLQFTSLRPSDGNQGDRDIFFSSSSQLQDDKQVPYFVFNLFGPRDCFGDFFSQ
jgi:hypothetical protein